MRILHTKMDLKIKNKGIKTKKRPQKFEGGFTNQKMLCSFYIFLSSIAACAAANLAIGTLNGEQLT